MAKTIAEINEKIKQGKAVVVTAEEIIGFVKEKGAKKAAREVGMSVFCVQVSVTGSYSSTVARILLPLLPPIT